MPTTRVAGWFQIAVGVAIVGWWTIAAVADGIGELDEGRIDIVFHIAAELVMAALLITAGGSILRRGTTRRATMVSGLALGTLLYSSINSPGYFAEQGAWWAVGMFAAIGAAAVGAVLLLRADAPPENAAQPRPERAGTGYGRTP